MVFITDTTGTIQWANCFFSDLFDLPDTSATGKKISAVFHEDHEESVIDCAEIAASGIMRKGVMKSICLPTSEEKTLKLDYFPWRDNAGEIRGVIGFGLDITEQVHMDQIKGHVYQQIEKNIEQFAILGDHLRNPLTVIIGLCDGMADEKLAQKIVTQAKEIDSIITRIDNGWIESEKIRDFLKKYYDVGVRGTHELVARAIHEEYRAQQETEGINEDKNPSMRPWHELPPYLKETNIQQAEDIARKLSAINCAIGVAIDEHGPLFAFTDAEVELLAVPEHERWMKEKLRRGWRFGPVRSDYDRVHDCLVPWEILPEAQKEKDRHAIKVLPSVLAKVHLKIVRF
jgi:hypothetical protein